MSSSVYLYVESLTQLTAFWDAIITSIVGDTLCDTSCIKILDHLLVCITVYEPISYVYYKKLYLETIWEEFFKKGKIA